RPARAGPSPAASSSAARAAPVRRSWWWSSSWRILVERAVDDGARVAKVVVQIKGAVDLGAGEPSGDVRVGSQERAEAPLARRCPQRALLNQLVCRLARHSLAHQLEQHGLAEEEAARHLQVAAHALGVDDQSVDQAGGASKHEVAEAGAVGADDPLDRRVRDVALVPE